MGKEEFKGFVRHHPELTKHVNKEGMTWQKFYEMYELYGETNDVWNPYFEKQSTGKEKKDLSFQELTRFLKQVDLDTLRKGVGNLQKALTVVQELGFGKEKQVMQKPYEPRPMYKYFED